MLRRSENPTSKGEMSDAGREVDLWVDYADDQFRLVAAGQFKSSVWRLSAQSRHSGLTGLSGLL